MPQESLPILPHCSCLPEREVLYSFLTLECRHQEFYVLMRNQAYWVGFPGLLILKGVEKPQEIRLTFNISIYFSMNPLLKVSFSLLGEIEQKTLSSTEIFLIYNSEEVPIP